MFILSTTRHTPADNWNQKTEKPINKDKIDTTKRNYGDLIDIYNLETEMQEKIQVMNINVHNHLLMINEDLHKILSMISKG